MDREQEQIQPTPDQFQKLKMFWAQTHSKLNQIYLRIERREACLAAQQ